MTRRSKTMKRRHSTNQYVEGVKEGSRAWLAKTITLIESNAAKHKDQAQEVLKELYSSTGASIRVGITGVPGAGKSTFIEKFGLYLCEQGHKVAVLAIDPSSSVTGGSILGDKTRMEELSKHPRAFIRPSPSQGTLGGVHRKTRETMLLCEAGGYDVIIIETVGVGQSEFLVKDMVDFFFLLTLTGAGDELQGMKKGIMELVQLICINKADGDNRERARIAKGELETLLHVLAPNDQEWATKVMTCSALYEEQVADVWSVIQQYVLHMKSIGRFEQKRSDQLKQWVRTLINDQLLASFYQHPVSKASLAHAEKELTAGNVTVAEALEDLIEQYEANIVLKYKKEGL
ncbi:methylmalonyl Co-A mutase-associated GTPase MeaB [Priestia koreensis]|nr:methylmalonyl Co-A mutase-associated GTPase MeaB [Priestia koreensis]